MQSTRIMHSLLVVFQPTLLMLDPSTYVEGPSKLNGEPVSTRVTSMHACVRQPGTRIGLQISAASSQPIASRLG
ncbi:hypothetical protein GGTG_00468 [Gaeumannomyces tritici R3-111a-1]|uniref:Secreted protein n=1 Tax=Gaeumannomyces tritici (strain R3-111a-1) TaxID=644352 RepID=J3NGS9_GAET3|nr:hypothetical protein GGTG_00468 [Gaeumannomyces tritici R3-111a-1]EJT80469.1 hypothetical protein GGTG_00468 [Gaeumannomyces tritici R3-111a-1]